MFSSELFQKFPVLIAKEIDFVIAYGKPLRELIDPGPVERKFHYLFVSGFIKDKLPLPGCLGLNLNNQGIAFVNGSINHIAAVLLPAAYGLLWLWSPSAVFLTGALLAGCSLALARLVPVDPSPGHETEWRGGPGIADPAGCPDRG